jgi:uncharacterized protein (DUF1015 family)
MAERIVYPFRGIHYDPAKTPDISLLIAPPYDVISPEMQGELYAREERNFVRLELPRGEEGEGNCYTCAAETLQSWLRAGVLVREEGPALYLVETEFALGGSTWRRRGVFALVRIPEEGERYVRGHEATFAGPKADRFQLMAATQAMISPVLAMSEDAEGEALRSLQSVDRPSDAEGMDYEGVRHRLWIVREAGFIDAVGAAIGAGPLFILDGHHRFETAKAYRDEMRRLHPDAPREAGFNFALLQILSARDEGVKVLPPHRLVSGLDREGARWLTARISEYFDVLPRPRPSWDRIGDLLEEARAEGKHVFAYYCADQSFARLVAKEGLLPPGDSPVDQLDVTILHRELLDLLAERGGVEISYVADAEAAAGAVTRGEADFVFLLRAPRVSEVMAVARAGELMPHKSTYFYPKAASGLVISDASPEPI